MPLDPVWPACVKPKPFVLSETGRSDLVGVSPHSVMLSNHLANTLWRWCRSHTLYVFALAAMANGIQNSVTSVATGNLIRSAHFSGMTSDMGNLLGQMVG
jgi:hypothetical protein